MIEFSPDPHFSVFVETDLLMFYFLSTGFFVQFHWTFPTLRLSKYSPCCLVSKGALYLLQTLPSILYSDIHSVSFSNHLLQARSGPEPEHKRGFHWRWLFLRKRQTISENWLLGCQLSFGCHIKCRAASHNGISPWLMTHECPTQV